MMAALDARGRRIAAVAEADAAARVAAQAGEALPGVVVVTEPGRVVLTGRGLARRAIDEPVLRWIGSLAR